MKRKRGGGKTPSPKTAKVWVRSGSSDAPPDPPPATPHETSSAAPPVPPPTTAQETVSAAPPHHAVLHFGSFGPQLLPTGNPSGAKPPSPQRNSNLSSPVTPQEMSSASQHSASASRSHSQPQPSGSLRPSPSPTQRNSNLSSPVTPQEVSSASQHSASASRSHSQPQLPRASFSSGSLRPSPSPTQRNSTPTQHPTSQATLQEMSSAYQHNASDSRTPVRPSPSPTQRNSTPTQHLSSQATLQEKVSPASNKSSISPFQQREMISPQSTMTGKMYMVKKPSPGGPAAAAAAAAPHNKDQSSPAGAEGSLLKGLVPKQPSPRNPAAAAAPAPHNKDQSSPAGAEGSLLKGLVPKQPSPRNPAAAQDNQKSSPVDAQDKKESGSTSGGRYNLRPRRVPATSGINLASQPVSCPPPPRRPAATPADPSGSATPFTPPLQPRRSSLTMSDDDKTLQMYLQYLQQHEKRNAIMVLLSPERMKLVVNFKNLLKSNRSLAHTICNAKDRLWNRLLGVSRTFLLQEFKNLGTRNPIEGISDETIEKGVSELALVFEYLPLNICTLLDFLDNTTLTALERILEGHLVIVLTDEGRRILHTLRALHTLLAFLIAHHKEGLSWGGNWKPEDWDVENSRTVSMSEVPSRFTDPSLPAKDLARLDISVVPKFLTRGHLRIPSGPVEKPKLLFIHCFRSDLRDTSGELSREDYHELMASHPFIMPSEARSDLLYAIYRFHKTFDWENDKDYDAVFTDKGLRNWTRGIVKGSSRVLRKIFYYGWDPASSHPPYGIYMGHLLVYQRHALEHIRNYERLIQKMKQLELLVSSRSPRFLARLIRLMFRHQKMVGEMRTRWDLYVGAGANKAV